MATIQVDLVMLPERFDLTYIDENGQPQRPIAIHRAIYGSLERFIGILVEHFAGAFPLWLAPVQAVVIPIADRHIEAAEELAAVLRARGLRVEVDASDNRMQNKIRLAQEQKVPYMLVLGDREIEARTVAPRARNAARGELAAENARLNEQLVERAEEAGVAEEQGPPRPRDPRHGGAGTGGRWRLEAVGEPLPGPARERVDTARILAHQSRRGAPVDRRAAARPVAGRPALRRHAAGRDDVERTVRRGHELHRDRYAAAGALRGGGDAAAGGPGGTGERRPPRAGPHVAVTLSYFDDVVSLDVIDDGRGFADPAGRRRRPGRPPYARRRPLRFGRHRVVGGRPAPRSRVRADHRVTP